jgi:hypothetical protein
MRALRQLAAVFVGAAVAGTCAAVPAFAVSGVPTGLGFGQDNQASFNYTDPTITLSGTLSAAGPASSSPITAASGITSPAAGLR